MTIKDSIAALQDAADQVGLAAKVEVNRYPTEHWLEYGPPWDRSLDLVPAVDIGKKSGRLCRSVAWGYFIEVHPDHLKESNHEAPPVPEVPDEPVHPRVDVYIDDMVPRINDLIQAHHKSMSGYTIKEQLAVARSIQARLAPMVRHRIDDEALVKSALAAAVQFLVIAVEVEEELQAQGTSAGKVHRK